VEFGILVSGLRELTGAKIKAAKAKSEADYRTHVSMQNQSPNLLPTAFM